MVGQQPGSTPAGCRRRYCGLPFTPGVDRNAIGDIELGGSHTGRKGYLHTHVHPTLTDWPQVLHHYYRVTLDDKGADARESILVPCHQARVGW